LPFGKVMVYLGHVQYAHLLIESRSDVGAGCKASAAGQC
jgi:hypothetical protein